MKKIITIHDQAHSAIMRLQQAGVEHTNQPYEVLLVVGVTTYKKQNMVPFCSSLIATLEQVNTIGMFTALQENLKQPFTFYSKESAPKIILPDTPVLPTNQCLGLARASVTWNGKVVFDKLNFIQYVEVDAKVKEHLLHIGGVQQIVQRSKHKSLERLFRAEAKII